MFKRKFLNGKIFTLCKSNIYLNSLHFINEINGIHRGIVDLIWNLIDGRGLGLVSGSRVSGLVRSGLVSAGLVVTFVLDVGDVTGITVDVIVDNLTATVREGRRCKSRWSCHHHGPRIGSCRRSDNRP